MWLYRWVGLVTAWVVALAGAIAVFLSPNQYEAGARIYVDTQSVLKPLMAGLAVQPNIDQQVAILSRTLISRPNAEKVIRMADLDLNVKSKTDKERLIDSLVSEIRIAGSNRGDNIYNISIRDENPDKAKRIVQSFVTIFVESGIGDNRKDADAARKFLQEQIKNYEKKLEEAEARVKEFKLRNLTLDADIGRDYFTRLTETNNQLRQAKLELREAENSRDAMKRQLMGDEDPLLSPGIPAPVADASVPELDGRIESLQRSLDELLRKYTEKHPDVVGTKRVIAQLEEERKKELAIRAKKPVSQQISAGSRINPVYQQLKVTLAESEANVASLRSRVAEYEGRLAQLKARAQMQPQIEAEFVQLNRDYEVHKRNYDGLVSRRESAQLSSEMDANASMAEFRLIEPPRVTPKPVAPNRPLLISGAFAAALAAGIVVAFLLSQVRPTFSDGRALREISGLPVLGVVSMLRNDKRVKRERRGMLAFIGMLVGLVCSYAAALGLLLVTARG